MPGAKLQLPQLWHSCLAGQWQLAKISRIYWVSVCAHTHASTHVFYCFSWPVSAAAIGGQIEWKAMRMEGWSVERGMHVAGRWGVLRVIGWTTAHPLCSKSGGICWPLWLPACSPARELREGISAPQSRWREGFFSKSSSLGFSLALLSSLSLLAVSPLCSGCSAQSAPASYSIVIYEWRRLAIQFWGLI